MVDAGSRRHGDREHAARRRRRDVRHERRQPPHRDGDRRPHRTADLAVHPAAEGPQPRRDRRGQPRRGDPRPPAVRRHARRGARLPRRANGAAAVGSPGRRHDGRLQHHQPAAHRQGQGHRRACRRRVCAPRVPRRIRRERQASVAVLHDSGTRRVRQRHVERGQLEDRRRRHVADRHVRSGARHALLADRQSGRDDRSVGARRRRQPVHRFGRRARSRYRPAQSGTTSSRPTTATTGIRRRTWCSSIACGAASSASCCCTPTATAISTCSIAPPARSSRARRSSTRTGTKASTRKGGRCPFRDRTRARKAASSSIRRLAAAPISSRRRTVRSPACSTWNTRRPARSTSARRRLRRRAASISAARPEEAPRPRGPRTIRRRAPGSRRSIRKPEKRCGTSSCSRDRSRMACSRPPAACCSPRRATATSSRSTRKTGKHLWHYQTGGNHAAAPISYAIDGRQYVALTAGNVLFSFTLPE